MSVIAMWAGRKRTVSWTWQYREQNVTIPWAERDRSVTRPWPTLGHIFLTITLYNYAEESLLNSWSFLSSSIQTLRFTTPWCSLPWTQNPLIHRSRAKSLLSCPPNNLFMTYFNTALPTVPTSLLWGWDNKLLKNFLLMYRTEQCHILQDNSIISHLADTI